MTADDYVTRFLSAGNRVDVRPDDGTAARLGLRVVEHLPRGWVGCNKCHAIRSATVAICPKCDCPEYHRSPLDVAADRLYGRDVKPLDRAPGIQRKGART